EQSVPLREGRPAARRGIPYAGRSGRSADAGAAAQEALLPRNPDARLLPARARRRPLPRVLRRPAGSGAHLARFRSAVFLAPARGLRTLPDLLAGDPGRAERFTGRAPESTKSAK